MPSQPHRPAAPSNRHTFLSLIAPILLAAISVCIAVQAQISPSPLPAHAPAAPASSDSLTNGLGSARQLIEHSQYAAAEAQLSQTLAAHPDSADAHFLLGYTLFREQRARDSLAQYTAGARTRNPTPDDLLIVASDYILLKDLPDANKWLRYALAEQPDDAQLWYLLGRTEYNQDHAAEAARAFERNLVLRPHDIRAEYNLGLTYEKLGRAADAVAAYNTAISWQNTAPRQDPQPYLDLGRLLLAQSKPAEALPPLTAAARFGAGNALAHQELGLALEALGRFDDAIVALQRAATLAPKAEQPHFFLGRIFRRLGRNAEAADQYAAVQRLLGARSDTATPNTDPQPTP